jgi:hypothetical protein
MPTMTLHPLATEYLDRLRKASARLPRGRRDELCAEIEAHLAEAIDPQAPDADALTVLDRLGEPEEIVAAEQPPAAAGVPARGGHEWAAILLLLVGGFVFWVGWIAGVVLLSESVSAPRYRADGMVNGVTTSS